MILLIDDEPRYARNYEEELEEKGLEVLLLTDVEKALELIESKKSDLRAIILDIMMPFKNTFSKDETLDGAHTGLRFYEKIADIIQVPIFILTNNSSVAVRTYFERVINPKCFFFQKRYYPPGDFAELVIKKIRM